MKYIVKYDDEDSYIVKKVPTEYDEDFFKIFNTFKEAKQYIIDCLEFKVEEYEETINFLKEVKESDYTL